LTICSGLAAVPAKSRVDDTRLISMTQSSHAAPMTARRRMR
jgi:hypothetical protein